MDFFDCVLSSLGSRIVGFLGLGALLLDTGIQDRDLEQTFGFFEGCCTVAD